MLSDGELILVAGALLAAGWLASLIAERFRLPALVLFLGLGMAIGSDGTDWIDFEDYELARRIGVITAAAILFEAGLAAGFAEIRPVLRPAVSLATVGTFITAGNHWAGCRLAVRLLVATGAADRVYPRSDGQRCRVRIAETSEAAWQAVADSRGRSRNG
ncbi:MAG: hypothetical protein E6I09_11165 [Chloroflexi bacterium]|nr:MAG: hypothetical protein E6I09_11165 [Chloroflexota bacterium]